ncbi:glycosyl transferase [Spirochaetia bacterium]|nr:glycosyl transferase [Spirochaetia bacterium]
MTIVVDCRMIGKSGVGVYIQEILPFLLNTDNSFILLGDKKKIQNITQKNQNAKNVTIIDCVVKTFSMQELFFFPRTICKIINRSDVFYSPYFNIPAGIKIPIFTTIHDIIFPDMKELTSTAGLAVRMWFFKRAARLSKKIFTVSYFSKSRIEHHLGKTKPVIVTYSAIRPFFLEPCANEHKKTETIIFIGNIKKHKGLNYLLDAFLKIKPLLPNHRLVIVGEKNNFRSADTGVMEKIENAGKSAIEFTGSIPEAALKKLLCESALLVQPSLYEGFCLPPLEAIACGTKALISDIPVLKEIYAGYPVDFFRAGDSANLAEKILSILYNREAPVIKLPADLAEKYSFGKTAETILSGLAGSFEKETLSSPRLMN